MTRAARSAIAAFVVLAVIGLVTQEGDRAYQATSFGRLPGGHGAAYDLLAALGLPVERSFEPVDALPDGVTVWWIEPRGLCHAPPAGEGGGDAPDPPAERGDAARAAQPAFEERVALDAFVARGGSAVVLLGPATCDALAGVALPPRRIPALPGLDPGAEQGDAAEVSGESDAPEGGAAEASDPIEAAFPEPIVRRVEGELVRSARRVESTGAASFRAESDEWRVVARLDDEPFALERRLGDGRLVVLADAFFLHNRWLDRADAAPLLLDLVARHGAPRIDEYQHGLRLETGTLRFLAGSPAVWPFAALTVLGVLVVWWGSALAGGAPREPEPPAPALGDFVGALAGLYARTRDVGTVAERYREVALARLRRHFGLPPETPASRLAERLRQRGTLRREQVARLAGRVAVGSRGELRARARELDEIVEEVCG